MAEFTTAFLYILVNEGSTYVNIAADHGGPTRFGITARTLSAWRDVPCGPAEVEGLTSPEAAQIYRALYWAPIGGSFLASQAAATALFDVAVLCGPATAVRLAQGVIGTPSDGCMGPKTLAALGEIGDAEFIPGLVKALKAHLTQVSELSGQSVFKAGWLSRCDKLETLVA